MGLGTYTNRQLAALWLTMVRTRHAVYVAGDGDLDAVLDMVNIQMDALADELHKRKPKHLTFHAWVLEMTLVVGAPKVEFDHDDLLCVRR